MPAKKIVLSDNPTILMVLQNSFFQREGFEMVQVQDGQNCFQTVEAEAPTLVVLDFAQIGEQTLTCCQSIKSDPLLAATPVLLILPEQAQEELADLCWDAGCDAVIHQPLAADRFLDAACALLGISRRLARRFPVNFQLALFDDVQKQHVGSCVNFNTGGMFLTTETLFPIDTRLTVEFLLPGLQMPLCCAVRVAWVNHPEGRKKNTLPCGLGLQFVNPCPTVKAALQEFLDRLTLED